MGGKARFEERRTVETKQATFDSRAKTIERALARENGKLIASLLWRLEPFPKKLLFMLNLTKRRMH